MQDAEAKTGECDVSPAKAGFDSFWDLDPRAYARGYQYAAPTALVEFVNGTLRGCEGMLLGEFLGVRPFIS